MGRPHDLFLRNLGITPAAIKQSMQREWGVEGALEDVPTDHVAELVRTRYASPDWIFRKSGASKL